MKRTISLLVGLMLTTSFGLFASGIKGESKEVDAESMEIVSKHISGRVVDVSTGEGLAGVNVSIEGTDMVAFTDFDGNFSFTNVKHESVSLSASFISYERATFSCNLSQDKVELALKSLY